MKRYAKFGYAAPFRFRVILEKLQGVQNDPPTRAKVKYLHFIHFFGVNDDAEHVFSALDIGKPNRNGDISNSVDELGILIFYTGSYREVAIKRHVRWPQWQLSGPADTKFSASAIRV